MAMLREIPLLDFGPRIFRLWSEEWLLLKAGELEGGQFNAMTVAWGGFGIMWSLPVAMVVVRPQRHTCAFMERHRDFTLCGFPPDWRPALDYCGAHSGRDVDKMRETGLTPLASRHVAAPGYAQASLWIECRTISVGELDPDGFLDARIAPNYPQHDYHRTFLGEILAVRAAEEQA